MDDAENGAYEVKEYSFIVCIANNATYDEAMEALKAATRKYFGDFLVDIGAITYHPPAVIDENELWSEWGSKIRLLMPCRN